MFAKGSFVASPLAGNNRMPPSKRVISKSQIEKEIYKTFELFKNKQEITIAKYLSKLDLEKTIPTKYRAIKYQYHTLIKLLIFKQLKGIKFQKQLEQYLKKHREERYKLGLKNVPNQRTISHFTNNILTDELKKLINFTPFIDYFIYFH